MKTDNLKTHKKNKKRHKTGKTKDQTRKIARTTWRSRKNNEHKFENLKENKNMQLTPNLKYETKLK